MRGRYAFVLYIEYIGFIDGAAEVRKCVCLQLRTSDDVDHIFGGVDGARN